MNYTEEFNNEKYNSIESIEAVFKRINRFSSQYNYCFATFIPQAVLPTILGIFVGIIDKFKQDKITGYFVNLNDRGICLIPLVVDDDKKIQIDFYGYIDIKAEDIKKIKIKTENFNFKRITIKLNNHTKYVMVTAKKIKGVIRHEENLNKFIELVK